MIIVILLAVAIAEIVVIGGISGTTNDKNKGSLAGGCLDIVVGAMMRSADEVNAVLVEMDFESIIESYEDLLILEAMGMIFTAIGIVMIAFAIYNRLNEDAGAIITKSNLPSLKKSERTVSVETTMPCPVCGAPHSQSDTFCGKCGANFG